MRKLGGILIVMALVSMFLAISIKFSITGKIVPGTLPVNWAKIADTCLLFSIAISLYFSNKK